MGARMAGDARRRASAGFTLIEMMVTLAILAIMITFAAPGMRDFFDSQVVKTPASDLYSSLVLARSEAIKQNAPVDLVPSASGWAQGWHVRVQSTGAVLRDQQAYQRVSIVSSQAGSITYGANGRLSSSATLFRITAVGNTRPRMRCVSVDVSGRPSVRVDSNSDQTVCD